jgi:signal peptidase I
MAEGAPRRSVLGFVLGGLLAIGFVLIAFVFELYNVPAGSMIPTLHVGDRFLTKRMARTPSRGEIAVFRYPKDPSKDFVKRVIAVGGDTIELRDGVPIVNGTPLSRRPVPGPCKYLDEGLDEGPHEYTCEAFDETSGSHTYRVYQDPSGDSPGSDSSPLRVMKVVTVPAGHYFMLGDNRDHSHDSRFWGLVSAEQMKGTAAYVVWTRATGLGRRPLD